MEHRVISELEKHKESLSKRLKEVYNFSEESAEIVWIEVQASLTEMIRLMREGKSAHERFYSDIIMNSNDAIIGIDNDFKVFLWNKGATNIFCYSREEMIGNGFEILIPKHLLARGEKEFLINEVNEKGFLSNYETERVNKNGDTLYVNISRFVVNDEYNNRMGSVGIVRDVTRLKILEKELREKENLALIGEVVSSIAHSLSNPLNIIAGNADYLLLEKKEDDQEYEELKTILDESARITKSIRHLLNFSRPLKIEKKKNDINKVIAGIIANSKYLVGNKKISFVKKTDNKIQSFLFGLNEIEEVISNIVTNAIQAIHKEGEIKISTSENKDFIQIKIADDGPGIPKENLEKIFLPFFSSKDYGKGTGLGLSIARKVVKEHGGEIFVESSQSKGTTFIIKLPYNPI